ncbi:MAG: hypothetical protein PHI19_05310 [Clostridia bacterium]|nr:hypothetical protein [Clostridia bacterium]
MIDIFNLLRYPKKFIKPCANGEGAAKTISKDHTVFWDTAAQDGPLGDIIEQKGEQVQSIVSYCKTKNGTLKLLRHIEFLQIELKSNKPNAVFAYNFYPKVELMLDGVEINREKLVSAEIKDTVILTANFMNGATVKRSFYPSLKHPAFIEKIEVTNHTDIKVTFTADEVKKRLSGKSSTIKKAFYGLPYKLEVGSRVVDTNGDFRSENPTGAKKLLVSGATGVCYIVYYAIKKGETLNFNAEKEIKDYLKSLSSQN